MNKVRITVAAGPNQGKTTIASIVKDALTAWGFTDVSLIDVPSKEPETKEPITKRIEAAKKRPVEIQVILVMEPSLCERCNEFPVAYLGARFCGAACSQLKEMGE